MLKKRCLLLEGKSKDNLDSQMITFLKSEIQVLWPDGWMSMNSLNKIYTTFSETKRVLNNTSSSVTSQVKSVNSSNSVKTLPQSFNNGNLSITPIVAKSEPSGNKLSVTNEVTVSKTFNDSSKYKTLPETSQSCDISPASPKLKLKPQSELLKPPVSNHVTKKEPSSIKLSSDDSVIILDGPTTPKPKSDDNYCQVIDLSDKTDLNKLKEAKKVKTPEPVWERYEYNTSITPTFSRVDYRMKPTQNTAGDDIQKVMENLKVLQKMSSPKKCVESAPTSSAVSVIAVNKSFAPKETSNETSSMQRYDYNKSDFNTGFQDEFQKQLFSALNQFPSNSNKSCNRSS